MSRSDGDEGSLAKFLGVPFEHQENHPGLRLRRDAYEPQDAGVRLPRKNGEGAEVLVKSDEQPRLPVGTIENLGVTRILGPVTGPDDIVPRAEQLLPSSSPDTCVEEEFHEEELMVNGSIRSFERMRRANSMQASTSLFSSQG